MSYLILTPHNLNGMNFDHLTPPGKRLWRVGKGVVSAFGMNASQGKPCRAWAQTLRCRHMWESEVDPSTQRLDKPRRETARLSLV